jgi:16S rRNA (adenine1518-N6/adenine1519-N6)-dimethyltransferase
LIFTMEEEKDIEYIEENNEELNFSAKKSLGQNFLHAPNVISAMAKAGEVSNSDKVLEIGPGKGALTKKLLEIGAKVIAIEKDDRAIPFLNEKFSEFVNSGQLSTLNADILEINDDYLKNLDKYKIIANIPYYITGELIRKFLESQNPPEKMVIMVQKEVAKRIVDEKESILSISVKVYGEAKYICTVPRKFFRPMPNVDSAVILIQNISKKFFEESKIDEKLFFEILKAGFAHKRKFVIRNLEDKIPREMLDKCWLNYNFPQDLRAENITVEMWKKIVGFTCIS